ncbi:double-strand break repair helicase AddA [Rhizobium sp. TRM96647]|uniref:double-strand break repair helicase AddA n=1 Tax=unclassified Rhizobium TaxID=2613769 RepID=UPI0021E77A58|nr:MULTISPECIES: double-strand break repair helicase AddA [unclassified Rhizobium]MCV3735112.1 double-strand break repair helicase AddA [Rhizobium sp. TRM96647]MCV3757482.1 double-strand break repair helicase AddA [Rhizobium sp. TRM96650]
MLEAERPPADDPGAWLGWTSRMQAAASDPSASAWVSANAGSGKTHVLTQRVIRLLLAGCRPSAILCLTYTKAAASEMSNRVFERLAEWAVLPDDELARRVEQIEGTVPDRLKLAEARRLFARALETPGGLKIQTIHAFCEALLHQFPLEANVAGHFAVLDDRAAAVLLADARRSLLTATSAEDDAALAGAFSTVLEIADDTGLDRLIEDIVASRSAIRAFIDEAAAHGGATALLRERLGFGPGDDAGSLVDAFWPPPGFDMAVFRRYLDTALELGSDTVKASAADLAALPELPTAAGRRQALCDLFFNGGGKPASIDRAFLSKKVKDRDPEFEPFFVDLQAHVIACDDRLRRFRMFEATRAALVIAARLIGDYEDLKRGRSLLDFDDLIERAATLLTRSDVGAWIHYKLDQGIDHFLVDEAQDTSPRQWEIIGALTGEFFAGASARPAIRTVFAVGDEKQSIYSFQGARPERFAEEGRKAGRRAGDADALFRSIRLLLSFRSTRDVLSAVDRVFAVADHARGLSPDGDAVIHASNRGQEPGAVDLWEVIAPAETIDEEDWTAPFDAVPEKAPVNVLARRIADTLAGWIGRETVTEKGTTRPMRPGDVIVLVRKRDAFVNALTRALKQPHNIPVGGADRLVLSGHIAVQDLLALGRFALLPEDDLSLAALLKSPLLGHSEETLMELAARRPEATSLWQHLQAQAPQDLFLGAVVRQLEAFIAIARELPAHDFYARVIGVLGGRAAFLARLGQEAGEIIDEFLSFALDQEENGLPGLQAFISTLELEAPTVKREQDKGRNEVRIMTVHAAKGLEAPVVFLVDSGGAPFTHTHMPKLRFLAAGRSDTLPAWLPVKDLGNDLTDLDAQRIRAQAEEEYRRLLYVAMTRAADRLVVCGYRGKRPISGTWHEMVTAGLSGDERCSATEFSAGPDTWCGAVWREASPQAGTPGEAIAETDETEAPLPEALGRPLPPLRHLPRPLSPSGAATVIDTGEADLRVGSALFATHAPSGAGRALERGRILHRLLQVLPGLPETDRPAAAERYLERAVRHWPDRDRARLSADVAAIMQDRSLAAIFSPRSRAEVEIMGTLGLGRTDYAVSGRIDRMVVTEDGVEIVDFKTNRQPPASPATIPFEHLAQLSIYRALLAPLYPGQTIRCGLVYTEAPAVYWLEDEAMTRSLAELATK